MDSDRTIRVCAVVFRDARGDVLTVRKSGARRFMLPGGKPESDETARQTAVRECEEEIGVRVAADDLTELGVFTAAAANEPGFTVHATVFAASLPIDPQPRAEIAELRWLNPNDPGPVALAPLLSQRVFPLL